MAAQIEGDIGAALRTALRRFASSVVVITVRYEGRRYAMAATAVNALSMEPPSIIACVNRGASIHPAIAEASHFAANVLSADHETVSRLCGGATKGEARFEVGAWDEHHRAPVLADAQAVIVCRRDERFDYGSHSIFVGRVEEVTTHGEINPLIYVDGRYTGLE